MFILLPLAEPFPANPIEPEAELAIDKLDIVLSVNPSWLFPVWFEQLLLLD